MKASILYLILFNFTILVACNVNSSTNRKKNDTITKQNSYNKNFIISKEKKSFKSIVSKIPKRFPIDTITSIYPNGQRLFTYIYSYNDSLDNHPIESFEVKSEKDSSILKIEKNNLKRIYEGINEDWYQIIPMFKIAQNAPLKIKLDFHIYNSNERVSNPDYIEQWISSLFTGNMFKFNTFGKIISDFVSVHSFIEYDFILTSNNHFLVKRTPTFDHPIRTNKDKQKLLALKSSLEKRNFPIDSTSKLTEELFFLNLNGIQTLNKELLNDPHVTTGGHIYYTDLLGFYLPYLTTIDSK